MPFPASPRQIYEENTLVAVICQLRFPPILEIAAELPTEFQNTIRDEYPLYQRRDPLAQIPNDLAAVISQLPLPRPLQGAEHVFQTADEGRSITLTSEFLAVTDRAYRRWEDFRAEIHRAEDALQAIYRPAFYVRAGLRYQDVVRKAELGLADVSWHELLNPAFTGLLAAEPVRQDVEASRTDSLIHVFPGTAARLKLSHGLVEASDGQTYGFDMDFFSEERSDVASVRDLLDAFHEQAGYLFRWAILPQVRDALRPSPVD